MQHQSMHFLRRMRRSLKKRRKRPAHWESCPEVAGSSGRKAEGSESPRMWIWSSHTHVIVLLIAEGLWWPLPCSSHRIRQREINLLKKIIVQNSVIIQESGRKSRLYALHYISNMLVFNNYLSLRLCNTLVWVGSNATFDIYYRTVNVSTSGCLSDSLPFSVSDLSCPRESKRYHTLWHSNAARKLHV